MSKPYRCYLHLACIMRKLVRGQEVRWHWDHLLSEFGRGTHAKPEPANSEEAGRCST